jgi:hypothetical protein
LEVTDTTLTEYAEDTVSENDRAPGETQLALSDATTHQYLDKVEAPQHFKKLKPVSALSVRTHE